MTPPPLRWRVRTGVGWREARVSVTAPGLGPVFRDGESRRRCIKSLASTASCMPGAPRGVSEVDVLLSGPSDWDPALAGGDDADGGDGDGGEGGAGALSSTGVSVAEAEQLLTAACAPSLRIPLLLSFLADDRAALLFNPVVRRMVGAAMAEPGCVAAPSSSLPSSLPSSPPSSPHGGSAAPCATSLLVPGTRAAHMPFLVPPSSTSVAVSALASELLHAPRAALQPLLRIAHSIVHMCRAAEFDAGCVTTMMWLVRLLVHVHRTAAGVPSCRARPDTAELRQLLQGGVSSVLSRWNAQAAAVPSRAYSVMFHAHAMLVAGCFIEHMRLHPHDTSKASTRQPREAPGASHVSTLLSGMAFLTMWHFGNYTLTCVTRCVRVDHIHLDTIVSCVTPCVLCWLLVSQVRRSSRAVELCTGGASHGGVCCVPPGVSATPPSIRDGGFQLRDATCLSQRSHDASRCGPVRGCWRGDAQSHGHPSHPAPTLRLHLYLLHVFTHRVQVCC